MVELVKRLRALTLNLLPVEVDPLSINDPTSRVITPEVITAYRGAAGDFTEAVRAIFNVHDATGVLIFLHASCHTVCYAHAPSLCGMRIIIQRIMERTEAEVVFLFTACNSTSASCPTSYRMRGSCTKDRPPCRA